jgi:hypothetical protein
MFVSKQMRLKQLQFWFRNLQEEAAIVQKRNIRQLWDSYFNQYLIKRFFHFWTNYHETIYGLPRTVMNQLFQRYIKRRTYRMHFCFWHGFVSYKYHRHRVSQVCANQQRLKLLDHCFTAWSAMLEIKIPRVLNFTNSVQMRLRTNYFQTWREFPDAQKSFMKKINHILMRCIFSWQKFMRRNKPKKTTEDQYQPPESSMYEAVRDRLRKRLEPLFLWNKFVNWKERKKTLDEQSPQFSMHDELTGRFRDTLANFRLLRRPLSLWLYLMRSGRLHKKQNQRESSSESTNMDDQDEIENELDGRYSGLYQ